MMEGGESRTVFELWDAFCVLVLEFIGRGQMVFGFGLDWIWIV